MRKLLRFSFPYTLSSKGSAASGGLFRLLTAARRGMVRAVAGGFFAGLTVFAGEVYAQGGAVQSGFAATASLTTPRLHPRTSEVLTYSFVVEKGSPSWWRIAFSWAGSAAIQSVEKNGQPLWLLQQSVSPSQQSVASWNRSDYGLDVMTRPDEFVPGDRLTIHFRLSVPDTVQSGSLDGWVGQAGRSESLVPCRSESSRLTIER